jgi:arylsulfatase A-like enzyme
VLLSVLLVCAAGAASTAQAADRPLNIIFLLTDDQRWDTLGVNGNAIIQTPHLDQLAREGVRFDNAFVTTSICVTSRASIVLGQYARRHGIWRFDQQLSEEQLARSYLGRLKEQGYHLGFIGKWGIGEPPEDYFDYSQAFGGQGQYRLEVDGVERHLTSVMGDQILEFLETAPKDRPFCLSVSFKAAHVQDSYDLSQEPFPYDRRFSDLYADVEIPLPSSALPSLFEALPGFLQDSEARLRWAIRFWGPARYQELVKGYYRLISGIDDVVGRLRAALAESGQAERTALVFTGDNGFYLGEYGLAGKWFAHEASIRVPLVIHDPRLRKEQTNRRVSSLALNIDLAPTILDLAGLPPESAMQGKSLMLLVNDDGVEWRSAFFYEHLFEHPRIPRSEAVRTERWKYVRYVDTDPPHEELYDLEADPQELRNLAGVSGYASILDERRRSWEEWREAAQ